MLSTSANQVNFTEQGTWNGNNYEAEVVRAVVDYAADESILCLNLAPDFQAYALAEEAALHGCPENGGQGHWNQTAHRLAADRIYEFLVQEELVP